MQEIIKESDTVTQLCGIQNFCENKNYQLSKYCFKTVCADGVLLFNTFTRNLILLSDKEFSNYEQDISLKKTLVEKRFLVENGFDEKALADQTFNIIKMFNSTSNGIKKFTVFPTTDCNARCFYCFELSRKRINMTEKTAHDVADYIAKSKSEDAVKIHWFGGEPLYNSEAIDIICNDLRNKNVEYKSAMTSNGYLFNRETVIKAKELWKLKSVQITLDGTEEVYNKTKAYIYKTGNPFEIVINNIELLLENGISVSVRMNMDSKNARDLIELADILGKRFSGKKDFTVYIALLVEHTKSVSLFTDDNTALEAYRILEDKLRHYGILLKKKLGNIVKTVHCLADSDNAVTILPDGKLGKCEHYTDDNFVGSIYENGFSDEVVQKFKEPIDPIDECNDCAYYPMCTALKNCPDKPNICSQFTRWTTFDALKDSMVNTYENWRAEQET